MKIKHQTFNFWKGVLETHFYAGRRENNERPLLVVQHFEPRPKKKSKKKTKRKSS